MKIRYWVMGYTVCMLVAAAILYNFISTKEPVRDMVYYNDVRQQAEERLLTEKESYADIERDCGCEILFLSDPNYQSRLNEMIQNRDVIFDYFEEDTLVAKFGWADDRKHEEEHRTRVFQAGFAIWFLVLLGGYGLLAVIYYYVLKPFQELQRFSAQIAKGDLELPLPIHKRNLFGAFTESFDIMREELKQAREREYEIDRSKKELVAQLSHDIKTPVATIKASCEVMRLQNKDVTGNEKLDVIEAKADTIDKLISNLFHATMVELEALKVEPQGESSLCIMKMFLDVQYDNEIVFINDVPECLLYIDKLRLEQVISNLINNSYKYAKTPIEVTFSDKQNGIEICIRDRGPGVPEDELALLMEKYYRGTNAKGQEGSGLGLYLSKCFMDRMKGGMECYCEEGFVVELFVRKMTGEKM